MKRPMQAIRRTIKLIMPAFVVRWRLACKSGCKLPYVSDSAIVRLVVALCPYIVSAILQQRTKGDRRIIKYFLPYGLMCRHVKAKYGMEAGNSEMDSGKWGLLRFVSPYGLVKWWDGEDGHRTVGQHRTMDKKVAVTGNSAKGKSSDRRLSLFDALFFSRSDGESAVALVQGVDTLPAYDSAALFTVNPNTKNTVDKIRNKIIVGERSGTGAGVGAKAKEQQAVQEQIEKLREVRRSRPMKDLTLVVSFIGDQYAECIDSWMLFEHLQKRGVASRYIARAGSRFYEERIKDSPLASNVICVDGLNILDEAMDELARAKTVIMEDVSLVTGLQDFLREDPDCELVFLQHGYTFLKASATHASFFHRFNTVNVNSYAEADFLRKFFQDFEMTRSTPRFVVAGLPRFDLLPKAEGEGERIVLVALTWRRDFTSVEKLSESFYWRRLLAFLGGQKVKSLREQGVKVVFAAHHALLRCLKGEALPPFPDGIKVCRTVEISRWIRKASMLVTDYSSLAFDFLYQGKPVVFWIPDIEDPNLRPETRAELSFAKKQTRKIFNVADSVNEAVDMVAHYQRSSFALEPEKRQIAASFFGTRDESVCERLVSALGLGGNGEVLEGGK